MNLSNWISYSRPNPEARLRLFCFPYAGGGASAYRLWWERLPASVELLAIQPPGRENRLREPTLTNFSRFMTQLTEAIQPTLTMPFAFFGHSMGGLLCFELARQLRRQNLPQPDHLFISAFRAPHVLRRTEPIHNLPDPEFIAELRRLNGTPQQVYNEPDLLALLLPLLRHDFSLVDDYCYSEEPPLDMPISVFGGTEDNEVTMDELKAWKSHSNGKFRLRMLPGDHFFLNTRQPLILRAICQDLLPVLN